MLNTRITRFCELISVPRTYLPEYFAPVKYTYFGIGHVFIDSDTITLKPQDFH